jgi:hypothetical protein
MKSGITIKIFNWLTKLMAICCFSVYAVGYFTGNQQITAYSIAMNFALLVIVNYRLFTENKHGYSQNKNLYIVLVVVAALLLTLSIANSFNRLYRSVSYTHLTLPTN